MLGEPHQPLLQRYVVSNMTVNPGDTRFLAQVKTGGNIHAGGNVTTDVPAPAGAAAPVNLPIRVSTDGRLAIEDTNLTHRQPKVFYAEKKIVGQSNKALAKNKSKYQLFSSAANALTVPDQKGKQHQLDEIQPQEVPDTSRGKAYTGVSNNRGVGTSVEVDCTEVCKAILGKDPGFVMPVLQKSLPLKSSFLHEYRLAVYMDGRHAMGKKTATSRMKASQNQNPQPNNFDAIAQSYMDLRTNHAQVAQAIEAELGINEQARAKVGQAFVSSTLATPGTNITDYAANLGGGATLPKASTWGSHYGSVVATSAGDTVTLENYARDQEGGMQTGAMYYFQMYGPPSQPTQTWHHFWSTAAGRKAVNSITTVLGR